MKVQDPLALESQVCFALSLASRAVIAAYKPVLEHAFYTFWSGLPGDTFTPQSPLRFGEYEVRIPQLASLVPVRPLARPRLTTGRSRRCGR